jgi:hypothetical protein
MPRQIILASHLDPITWLNRNGLIASIIIKRSDGFPFLAFDVSRPSFCAVNCIHSADGLAVEEDFDVGCTVVDMRGCDGEIG